jgi:murein L,D-transpeptidase YcbB/YkuD
VRSEGAELLKCLRAAWRDGLDPSEYPVDELEQKFATVRNAATPAADIAWLDAKLSYTFFEFAAHLYRGRIHPKRISPAWQLGARRKRLVPLLEEALAHRSICGALANMTPAIPEYAALRQGLAQYRRIAQEGGWPPLSNEHPLTKGDRGERVNRLRESLEKQGDLPSRSTRGNLAFDEELAAAVRSFESRNGLAVDGVADPAMLAVLNQPVETVIRQIELNLERMRWLPDEVGKRYLRVNIPNYRLELIEDGRPVLEMRVVVGKKANPTPVFSDQMTHLTFNPFWNIPERIALKETVPLLRKDPKYAENHGIQVVMKGDHEEVVDPSEIRWTAIREDDKTFPYLLRQQPGPGNALGRVKFMFPNRFNVYLHDTPTRHLFNDRERDYSHGCVRVEHPAELAEYLLKGKPGWNADRIQRAMESDDEQSVTLEDPLPVHIVYWSAWIGVRGELQRRPDIYDLDTTQERMIDQRALRQLSQR